MKLSTCLLLVVASTTASAASTTEPPPDGTTSPSSSTEMPLEDMVTRIEESFEDMMAVLRAKECPLLETFMRSLEEFNSRGVHPSETKEYVIRQMRELEHSAAQKLQEAADLSEEERLTFSRMGAKTAETLAMLDKMAAADVARLLRSLKHMMFQSQQADA